MRPLLPRRLGSRCHELYVRARIVSSKHKEGVLSPDEMEQAWTQPVVTEVR